MTASTTGIRMFTSCFLLAISNLVPNTRTLLSHSLQVQHSLSSYHFLLLLNLLDQHSILCLLISDKGCHNELQFMVEVNIVICYFRQCQYVKTQPWPACVNKYHISIRGASLLPCYYGNLLRVLLGILNVKCDYLL